MTTDKTQLTPPIETQPTPPIETQTQTQDHQALGQALKLVIAEKQLNQRKLAEITEIDARRISAIVTGHANPTYRTLLRLCQGLDMRPSDLTIRAELLLDEAAAQDRSHGV
jgi:transcriptional regulator with XRE-family HTH domain